MNYFGYGMLCLGVVLLLALVAWRVGKLRHRAVQVAAIGLCGLAMYCHVQAEMRGEYHRMAQQIADPLTKNWLQPFALSNAGQLLMTTLQKLIYALNVVITFIDEHQIMLTVVITGIIAAVIWIRQNLK